MASLYNIYRHVSGQRRRDNPPSSHYCDDHYLPAINPMFSFYYCGGHRQTRSARPRVTVARTVPALNQSGSRSHYHSPNNHIPCWVEAAGGRERETNKGRIDKRSRPLWCNPHGSDRPPLALCLKEVTRTEGIVDAKGITRRDAWWSSAIYSPSRSLACCISRLRSRTNYPLYKTWIG